ncbi:HAD family hydrolase [Rhodovulum sp. DZ06]|uniref:HAD family hydrolase n=1 Tax=Rhodovulum sp. DZ06 TaxID=3425126 RepID=UPI003D32F9DB
MTRLSPPEAVVFDVGNVLVEWDPGRVYADLLPDPEARAAFHARVDLSAMNIAGDRGRLAPNVAALAEAHPEDAHLVHPWYARWEEMFAPRIEGSFTLMAALREAGVKVFGLTNFAADTWAGKATQIHPELAAFDLVVVSGEEGVIKPEPRIYEILEERSGLSGAQLFFADDKPENIAAAEARGWRGHVFTGPEGLAEALRAAGLPV